MIKSKKNNIFYIYRYIRLDINTPFYVGKGSGNRAIRMDTHNEYCNRISQKHGHRIEYIIVNISEKMAFKKEAEFIKMYKKYKYCEANFSNGGEGPSGRKMTDEQRAEVSRNLTGRPVSNQKLNLRL